MKAEHKQSIAIDRYTKFILTVIAACLVIQVTKPLFDGDLIPAANAQDITPETFNLNHFATWFHGSYAENLPNGNGILRVRIVNDDFSPVPVRGTTENHRPVIVKDQ